MLLLPTVFSPMWVINVDPPKCMHACTYMCTHTFCYLFVDNTILFLYFALPGSLLIN